MEQTHEQLRDLLGAYSVDAVDDDERAEIESHLAECDLCRAEVAAHREALSLLTPSSEPPVALWEAIAAQLEATNSEPELAPVIPLHGRRRRVLAGLAAAAALVAVSVGITLALEHRSGLGSPTATAPIVAHQARNVTGKALLYHPDAPGGVVVVSLTRISAPPAGHHYEVWVLRAGGGAGMEAVGSFFPRSGSARLELPLPGPGVYRALDISLQDDGGPPVHSQISVAGATF